MKAVRYFSGLGNTKAVAGEFRLSPEETTALYQFFYQMPEEERAKKGE